MSVQSWPDVGYQGCVRHSRLRLGPLAAANVMDPARGRLGLGAAGAANVRSVRPNFVRTQRPIDRTFFRTFGTGTGTGTGVAELFPNFRRTFARTSPGVRPNAAHPCGRRGALSEDLVAARLIVQVVVDDVPVARLGPASGFHQLSRTPLPGLQVDQAGDGLQVARAEHSIPQFTCRVNDASHVQTDGYRREPRQFVIAQIVIRETCPWHADRSSRPGRPLVSLSTVR